MSKSTVRNRFPRLAVRWAVALAVMAAVVAPPPPCRSARRYRRRHRPATRSGPER